MSKLSTLVNSLWFRITTAFVIVLFIVTTITLGAVNVITEREFSDYVAGRSNAVEAVLATTVPPGPFEMSQLPTAVPLPTAVEMAPEMVENSLRFGDGEQRRGIVELDINPAARIAARQAAMEAVVAAAVPSSGDPASLRFLDSVRSSIRLATLIASAAAILLGTALARQITRPLSHLQQASHALAQGERGVRVPDSSRGEIGQVAESFNQMVAHLEKQEGLRRQMVADVAHELRTPLTVIRSNLEAMLDGLIDPTREELGELHDEVRRLSRLIDDLRLLSLADAQQLTLSPAVVDLHELVATTVARMAPVAETRAIYLAGTNGSAPLLVQGDRDKLLQALGNLVDNALRHTPSGGRVQVAAVRNGQQAQLSVADTGPGIPAEDLPHLFDRFWRGDKSRSRDSGGSGLGLAIVRQIADLHGGRVDVISPPGSGAIFTISVPLSRKTP